MEAGFLYGAAVFRATVIRERDEKDIVFASTETRRV